MLKTTYLTLLTSCCFLILTSINNANANNVPQHSTSLVETDIKLFDFNVSPNPAKEVINIEFTKNITGIVYIHDGIGNQVLEQEVNNELNKKISLRELNSGIYFISVKTNAKTMIKRFIKY